MNKVEFKNFISNQVREEVRDYFFSHTEEEFREHYNLSHANMRELKKLYALFYSKEQIAEKRKTTWQDKSDKNITQLIEKVTEQDLIDFYITKNNRFNDTYKHFNITKNELLDLLKLYNCKKDKQQSNILSKETKKTKYNNENYNNRELATTTCVEKYSVENPFQSAELMKNVYCTKELNNGKGNANNWVKNQETRIKNSGSLEESYRLGQETFKKTCLEKYGVDNIAKVDEIKDKIKSATKNAFIEKYGVECYWQLDTATRSYKSRDSKPNLEFKSILLENNLYIDDNINREFPVGNKIYDFKIGNTLLEINPTATHNSTWGIYGEPKQVDYHYNKSKIARENGYRCICIWDWDDIDKIINLLKPREKIFARNCEVKIVQKEEAAKFINENHLQNYAKDDIRLGLFYKNELVSIMTFDKPRYNKNYEYELIRYCSSKNVIGGAEKLFNHFIKEYTPKSIISYCDLSKFDGKTYEKLGFTLKNISVGKHWYNIKTGQHITDNLLRQRGFDQLFGTNYGKNTSNEELMKLNGFVEVYDCGQATYIKKF